MAENIKQGSSSAARPAPDAKGNAQAPPGRTAPSLKYSLPTADASEEVRRAYQDAGRQLNRLFGWGAGGLLLLAGALVAWGPRDAGTVPTPTAGYAFRQAGTVIGPDSSTWVWALADTAGRARLLLSANQGRTWRVCALGLRGGQARALALGWGAPGRGLVVGDSGQVRVVEDVFGTPRIAQSQRLTYLDRFSKQRLAHALFAVAVAPDGRSAVVLGRGAGPGEEGKVYHTTNGTRWVSRYLHSGAEGEASDAYEVSPPLLVVPEPGTPATFQVASVEHFYRLGAPPDTLFNGLLAATGKRRALPDSVPVVAAFAPATKAAFTHSNKNNPYSEIMANGLARRYYRGNTTYATYLLPTRDTLLFAAPPHLVAVVPAIAGSARAVLLANTAAGGQVHRVPSLGPGLTALDTAYYRQKRWKEEEARVRAAALVPQAAR